MSVRKIAVIDLGTNTFHLLLAHVYPGKFDIYWKERETVRIGKGGINQRQITEEAQERAMKALFNFKAVIEKEGITEVHATATSAFRNAKNSAELVARIAKETGIRIQIIDGNQEAEYIFFGVNESLHLGNKNVMVMDIGGGSVEFIIGYRQKILWKQSFEIGAQRLLDLFVSNDPITREEIKNIEAYLGQQLQPLHAAVQKYAPVVLIGASGTFDTLSEIYQHQKQKFANQDATEYPITYKGYSRVYKEIINKDRAQRMEIPGMIEMRVDMIVVACELLNFVLNKYQIKKIRVSAYALKEGVLAKLVQATS